MAVLHCAARHGQPELAKAAVEQLQLMGATLREYHFAPIVEAFVQCGQLKTALQTLAFMRSHNVPPNPQTASTIFDHISSSLGRTDEAFNMLYDLHADTGVVDITAMNVVIQSAVHQGDLARAVGIYSAAGDWNLKPTLETFNTVLRGCLVHKKSEHMTHIFEHMVANNIDPDAQTYEILIQVELLSDQHYEDAFWRLEQMKSAGFKPTLSVYERIARKCFNHNDTRFQAVLDEIKSQGYEVSPATQAYFQRGGRQDQGRQSTWLDNVRAESEERYGA